MFHVKHPPRPTSAQGVFVCSAAAGRAYAELLATEGVIRGLIGPREVPRLWDRHLLNCAVLADLIPRDADVCDIGTGAGLPGMVLAIARPDLAVTLVEPLLRRTTFLDEVVAELALDNVEVVRAGPKSCMDGAEFSVVTSRAVAPLGRLLDWSMPSMQLFGPCPDHLDVVQGELGHDLVQEGGATQQRLDQRHAAGRVGGWPAPVPAGRRRCPGRTRRRPRVARRPAPRSSAGGGPTGAAPRGARSGRGPRPASASRAAYRSARSRRAANTPCAERRHRGCFT